MSSMSDASPPSELPAHGSASDHDDQRMPSQLHGREWSKDIVEGMMGLQLPQWSEDPPSDDEEVFHVAFFQDFLRNKSAFLTWLCAKLKVKDEKEIVHLRKRKFEEGLLSKEQKLLEQLSKVRQQMGLNPPSPKRARLSSSLASSGASASSAASSSASSDKPKLSRLGMCRLLKSQAEVAHCGGEGGKYDEHTLTKLRNTWVLLRRDHDVDELQVEETTPDEAALSVDLCIFNQFHLRYHQWMWEVYLANQKKPGSEPSSEPGSETGVEELLER